MSKPCILWRPDMIYVSLAPSLSLTLSDHFEASHAGLETSESLEGRNKLRSYSKFQLQ